MRIIIYCVTVRDTPLPATATYYISDAYSPHRYKISRTPPIGAWTPRESFQAFSSYVPGTTRIYVVEAPPAPEPP
jgi:hypothetical protein